MPTPLVKEQVDDLIATAEQVLALRRLKAELFPSETFSTGGDFHIIDKALRARVLSLAGQIAGRLH